MRCCESWTRAGRAQGNKKLGIINGQARKLPHPKYPAAAKVAGISGEVRIEVTVDILSGKVIEAKAISGPQLLIPPAIEAAKRAEFDPVMMDGPILHYIQGILVYNFRLPKRH